MKFALFALLALSSLSSFANDNTPCAKKQIAAARKQMAKDYGVSVKKVYVLNYELGAWTEATGNNTGSDNVTVAIARDGGAPAVEIYTVAAKQIGNTADCKVLNVTLY